MRWPPQAVQLLLNEFPTFSQAVVVEGQLDRHPEDTATDTLRLEYLAVVPYCIAE